MESYKIQIGGKTLKYPPKVMSDQDPDPLGLGERRRLSEGKTEEIDDMDDSDSQVDISLDETPEISARVINQTSPLRPSPPTPAPKPRSKPTKKGMARRKDRSLLRIVKILLFMLRDNQRRNQTLEYLWQ